MHTDEHSREVLYHISKLSMDTVNVERTVHNRRCNPRVCTWCDTVQCSMGGDVFKFKNSGLNFVTALARVSRNSLNDPPGEANLSGTGIYVTRDKTVESGPLGPSLLSDTTEPPAPNQQEHPISQINHHCTSEYQSPNRQHNWEAQAANQDTPPQSLISSLKSQNRAAPMAPIKEWCLRNI
jgi:hypothetical protein